MKIATAMFTVDDSKLTDIKTAFKHNDTLYCVDCWTIDDASAESTKPFLAYKLIKALYDVDGKGVCIRYDKSGMPCPSPYLFI